MTAKIVMDKGGGPVVGSMTLTAAEVSTPITLSNLDDSGVLGWRWEVIDSPELSPTLNPLPAPTFDSTAVLANDVKGHSLLVRLTTYEDAERLVVNDVDQRVIAVRFDPPFDWIIPAAGQSVERSDVRGWAEDVNRVIREVHASLDKAQVDWKDSVRVATTAPLPANTRVGNTTTATANGAFPAQDGVSLAVGDSYLDQSEVTGVDQGAWVLSDLGSAGTPWISIRRNDFDSDADVTARATFPVSEGAVNGGKDFVLTNTDPIVINTDPLVFAEKGGGGGGIEIVADVAAMKALDAAAFDIGAPFEMVSLLDQWLLVDDAVLFAAFDDITIVKPTTPVGNRVYVRRNLGNERWRRQVTWFIDPLNGDDENTGLTDSTEIKTWAEVNRRMGPSPVIHITPTYTIESSLGGGGGIETDPVMFPGWVFVGVTPEVILTGVPVVVQSDNFTATTSLDASADQPQEIEDTVNDLTAGQGERIQSGGEYAWGLDNTDPNVLRTSPFTGGHLPGSTDAYTIETLPVALVQDCTFSGGDNVQVIFQDMHLSFAEYCELGSAIFCRNCEVSDSVLVGGATAIFEGCYFGDQSRFINVFANFIDCGFQTPQQFHDCVVRLKDCGSEDTFNEKIIMDDGGSAGFFDMGGPRNVFYVVADSAFGVYAPSLSFGSGGSVGFYINETDTVYVGDFAKLWGAAVAARGIACLGKLFWTNTIPSLKGTVADVRIGTVDRSYAAVAGGLADVDYGAIFRPRETVV